MTGSVKIDHLQRWSQIFRSDRTETGPFHLISYLNFQGLSFLTEWKALKGSEDNIQFA